MMIRSTPALSVIVDTGHVPHAPTSSTWTTLSASMLLEDDVAAVALERRPDGLDRLEDVGFPVVGVGVSGHRAAPLGRVGHPVSMSNDSDSAHGLHARRRTSAPSAWSCPARSA